MRSLPEKREIAFIQRVRVARLRNVTSGREAVSDSEFLYANPTVRSVNAMFGGRPQHLAARERKPKDRLDADGPHLVTTHGNDSPILRHSPNLRFCSHQL